MVKDPAAFLKWFKDRGVYTIARIPVSKDNLLAQAHPEWAVINANTGNIWRDPEKMGWVDPNHEAVWDYNVELAVEAARMGFDEVQYDYVRFPTDGNVGVAQFSLPNTEENRLAAIAGLLQRTQAALKPLGIEVGCRRVRLCVVGVQRSRHRPAYRNDRTVHRRPVADGLPVHVRFRSAR